MIYVPRLDPISALFLSIGRTVGRVFYSEQWSDFRLTGETGQSDAFPSGACFATVTLTTRRLFTVQRETLRIARPKAVGFWIRLDTSQHTGGYEVERLEIAERLRMESVRASDPLRAEA